VSLTTTLLAQIFCVGRAVSLPHLSVFVECNRVIPIFNFLSEN